MWYALTMRPAVVVSAALLALAGCSSDEPGPAPTVPRVVLSVAGDYPTTVTVTESTCPDLAVQPNVTAVAHREGSTNVTLIHADQSYAGTVTPSGAFTLVPKAVDLGNGVTHTIAIDGRFSTTGFTATVKATVTTNSQPTCAYTVAWVGTKDGPPNTIP